MLPRKFLFFSRSEILDTAAALAPLQYGDFAVLGLAGWMPAGLSSWMLELVNVSTVLP
jgi:YidC/Oxa1 family membrane protein insertase